MNQRQAVRAAPFDAEMLTGDTGETEDATAHTSDLKLWLRLLTCANLIEANIRRRLRDEFGTTLPRFDLMAQLDRAGDGMSLNEASRRMMVSNGNLTGLVERLVMEGVIDRQTAHHDRRTQIIRLTPSGHTAFRRMAAAHAGWVAELFSDLSEADVAAMMQALARMKSSVRHATGEANP